MVTLTWGLKQEVNSIQLCLSIIASHLLKMWAFAETTDAHISLRGLSTDTFIKTFMLARQNQLF